MDILRALFAILMILHGLTSFPYSREDRWKVGLALGCISFVIAGTLALSLASWWALLGGGALGYGIPLIHILMMEGKHRKPKPPRNIDDMSHQDIVLWLAKQGKWRAWNRPLLELVARRLQDVSFPDFYYLCERANINLEAIIGDGRNPERAAIMLASSLHLTGSNILEQWASEPTGPSQPGKSELKKLAIIAYESAIALEPYSIPSYANLAQAYLMTEHDLQKADEYLQKGLTALKEIQSSDSLSPTRRSLLRDSFPEGDTEKMLTGLMRELRDYENA